MKGQTCATKIVLNNQIFVKKSDIADQFNQCFVNIGPKLASAISDSDGNPPQIYKNSPSSSFVLSQATERQVCHLLPNLSECKTSLYIPNKLIRIALAHLLKPFAQIYNESITTGGVPDIF